MSFTALGLCPPLLLAIEQQHYRTPTAIQKQAIPAVLAGRDVMAAAQTGTGKTAAFALPLLQRLSAGTTPANGVRVLALTPTRELAQQVFEHFKSYGRGLDLRFAVAYGGVSINPQMMALRSGVDVLVATPGRLLDLHAKNAVQFTALKTLVLDEADRMLELGFSRDINKLLALLPKQRQTLLFSATFSDAIRALAAQLLIKPVSIDVSPRNSAAKAVKQHIITVDKKRKTDLFCYLLAQKRWRQVLVFAKTRNGVDALLRVLREEGVRADSLHGEKTQPQRLAALNAFKAGELRVLVATDVAARGLDIESLPLVVNFDLPIVAEDYIHRIGRTARAGASGQAISLVSADEIHHLRDIEKRLKQPLLRKQVQDFEPDHAVPPSGSASLSKTKKPKKQKAGSVSKPKAGR